MSAQLLVPCRGSVTVCTTTKQAARCLRQSCFWQVDDILRELGLEAAADVKVGDVFYKGCSGGQKRRVSIGVELMKHPCKLLKLHASCCVAVSQHRRRGCMYMV